MADLIPIFINDTPFDKVSYCPIILLPSLSKVCRKIVHQQLNLFLKRNYPPFFVVSLQGYAAQHAVLNLINKWQSFLDKSRVLGTVLMDMSKALDFLTHELVLTKLYSCGVDMKGLELL